jgi:DNA (cytosine-5)-methyltransferase 1
MEQYDTFIEVFSGCGGLSCGLIKAGFKPLLLIDNVKDCVKTLQLNHPNTNIKEQDVTKLHLDDYKGKVHMLAGGIPCQSWSFAGKRLGLVDKRGNLFMDFIRLIKECDPNIFLIENVHGLLTHNKGNTFNIIKQLLSIDDTYNIDYKLLNSNDYDVPQKRKRVFIIGTKKEKGFIYNFPEPFNVGTTLIDAFKNIPECSEGCLYPERKLELFRKIPQGGCWINLNIEEQKEYLGKSIESEGGKRGILRRLSMNEPSLTLLTTPSQKQTERCHPTENRPLSIIEYTRIQTFPDDYKFYGSKSSKYKQIGNAVPVNMSYRIGLSLMNIGYSV